MADEIGRAVDPGHRRTGAQAQADAVRLGPDRLRRRGRHRRRHLHPDRAGGRHHGRPAVSIAFVIAAIACGLAAMCYAEFASTVPVAGSAYTFSYATLGELVAWIIGWDLVLELALGASVVSKGWSLYLGNLFTQFGGSLETTIEPRPDQLRLGRRADRRGDHLDPGAGHQAVGPGEHGDHRDQGRRRAAGDHRRLLLLQRLATSRRSSRRASRRPAGTKTRPGAAAAAADHRRRAVVVRGVRRAGGRVAGVLRVHRLRRGRHRGRGDQEPQAGPAARHLRLAGHRHRAVRAGHHRADRDGAVQRAGSAAAGRHATTTTRPPWRPRSPPSASTGRPTSSRSARWPA